MITGPRHRTLPILAAILSLLNQGWASAWAGAASPHENVGGSLCLPSGELSAEAKAAQDLFAALAADPDDQPDGHDHCPSCTLVSVAALSMSPAAHAAFVERQQPSLGFDVGLWHPALGPPLGSRAPPTRN